MQRGVSKSLLRVPTGLVSRRAVVLVALTALLIQSFPVFAQVDSGPKTIVVKMVDKSTGQWRFEPSNFTAIPGDTVRFLQEDVVPHNVEFKDPPKGSAIADISFGPFLMVRGEVYEIVIDKRFVVGKYKFVCTPHVALGMTGSIDIVDATVHSTN